ncbi:MAG: GtrA family protein [Candidatus Paceibacterota bacterium]
MVVLNLFLNYKERWKDELKRFFRFGWLSLPGSSLGLGTIFVLNYQGLGNTYSMIIGGAVNYIISFFIHKYWTFKEKSKKRTTTEEILYLVLSVTYLLSSIKMVSILMNIFGMENWQGQLWTIVVLAGPNYLVTKWIFKKPPT